MQSKWLPRAAATRAGARAAATATAEAGRPLAASRVATAGAGSTTRLGVGANRPL